MPTIFTRIIDGELPGTFVWRDERAVGFMSINPLTTGHVLVVPDRRGRPLDRPRRRPRGATCSRSPGSSAGPSQAAFACARVGLIIAGYEVPHAHVHVIPTTSMSQLNFANAATGRSGRARVAAEAIRAELRAAGRPEVTPP